MKASSLQVLRADEDATEAVITQGKVSFNMGTMTSAGQYTLVAEWREHRAGLPQVDARSPASTITVSPGQPADAQVRTCNTEAADLNAIVYASCLVPDEWDL